jgi:hypothetical protein
MGRRIRHNLESTSFDHRAAGTGTGRHFVVGYDGRAFIEGLENVAVVEIADLDTCGRVRLSVEGRRADGDRTCHMSMQSAPSYGTSNDTVVVTLTD